MENQDTLIKIEGLEKSYPLDDGDRTVPVLNGIDCEINAEDFAIVYGASGSGKSTLLNHIVGLESPTKGHIWVRGTDISKLSAEERAVFRAEKFGMVYQIFYWVKSLTVWENVALPLLLKGKTFGEAKKAAMKSLDTVGMTKYANKKPMQMSGGEQQRVGIARALINNPLIIVADEPTGNLDTHNADQVMQIFQELNKKHGRTIILVTHNLAYLPLANKTIAVKDGKVISAGTGVKTEIKKELQGVL